MRKDKETKILELLTREKRMGVRQLSESLGISQVTIRKYLDELETKHLIKRIHGYAQLESTDDIKGRLAYHYEKKTAIALKALELISDGDTIMIESGSCCALASLLIAQNRKNITIVTNSVFIADYIRNENGAQVVLLGGIYQKDSQCLVGPSIKDGAKNYNVNLLFIGTDGWNENLGFTNKDQLRAQAVRDMSESADNIIILTESEKFNTAGTVPLNLNQHNLCVITDDNLSPETRNKLEENNIKVII